jgi:protein SCO1/2
MGRRFLLIAALFALVIGSIFVWSTSEGAKAPPQAQPFGGDFTLTDHTGKPFSLSSASGSYVLMFFGFTHCPEACPLGLKKMSDALALLPEASRARLVPLLVTVDPERDTPAVMASYLSSFSPKITGLTGTPDQIADVTKRYAIYSEKALLDPSSSSDSPQNKGDYTMNHTTHFILLDPQGAFVKVYPADQTPQDLARDLTLVMGGG